MKYTLKLNCPAEDIKDRVAGIKQVRGFAGISLKDGKDVVDLAMSGRAPELEMAIGVEAKSYIRELELIGFTLSPAEGQSELGNDLKALIIKAVELDNDNLATKLIELRNQV